MRPAKSSLIQLLVEGKDDLHSITNLLERHGYDWNNDAQAPFVHDYDGIDSLLESLPLALKSLVRVGVVIDADLNPTNRWAQIEAILKASGIVPPPRPDHDGLVMPVAGLGKLELFGIWIMPNNQTPGALEDFLQRLVPAGDRCWQLADTSTKQARGLGAPLKEKDHPKGAIHTWLAWQDPPGKPFGTALSAHILNHDSSEALQFVAWFNRLFGSAVT
jgi:hypothetical protein